MVKQPPKTGRTSRTGEKLLPLNDALHKFKNSLVKLSYEQTGDIWLSFKIEDEIVREIKKYGTYDYYIMHTLLSDRFSSTFRNVYNFVDVGANIGPYTLALAKKIGDRGHVLSIEAGSETAQVLRDNVDLNRLSNVTIRQEIIGRGGELVSEHRADSSSQSAFIPIHSGSSRTRLDESTTVSLDSVCANMNLIDLIKIDVNGMDFEILLGAKTIIKKNRPALLVEFTASEISRTTFYELTSFLHEISYTTLFWRGHTISAIEPISFRTLESLWHDWQGYKSWMNLLFIPKPNS